MNDQKQWWGWRCNNGSIHTRPFTDGDELQACRSNPICAETYGPFESISESEATNQCFLALKQDTNRNEQINPHWIKPTMTVEQAAKHAALRSCTLSASFDSTMGIRIVAKRRST